MLTVSEQQQLTHLWAWAERVWKEEWCLLTSPDELALVSELFPGDMEHPDALYPIDLNAFNAMARPKGFLATWEPSGLLLFRLRI